MLSIFLFCDNIKNVTETLTKIPAFYKNSKCFRPCCMLQNPKDLFHHLLEI